MPINFDNISLKIPSPIQKLEDVLFDRHGIEVCVKREDLIHPAISGNKWRKLKYNLFEADRQQRRHLVSFGGAFSNHIYALSAAAKHFDFKFTAFVRGNYIDPENPSLNYAIDNGAQIIRISKEEYKLKEKGAIASAFLKENPDAFIIPEGGANEKAWSGVYEMLKEIELQFDDAPSHILVSAGTGATATGILKQLNETSELLIFNALNNPELKQTIERDAPNTKFEISQTYNFGGFAKVNIELVNFINEFKAKFEVPLDPIYNGKMFYGFMDLVDKAYFPKGSKILLIHTGGLQGINAHNYRYKDKIELLIN